MKIYAVTYRRDPGDDAWLVEVAGMPDVHTFGRTLEEAAVNAREAIAVTVDTVESELELEEHFAVADVDVEELTSLRDRAQELHEIYLSHCDLLRRVSRDGTPPGCWECRTTGAATGHALTPP